MEPGTKNKNKLKMFSFKNSHVVVKGDPRLGHVEPLILIHSGSLCSHYSSSLHTHQSLDGIIPQACNHACGCFHGSNYILIRRLLTLWLLCDMKEFRLDGFMYGTDKKKIRNIPRLSFAFGKSNKTKFPSCSSPSEAAKGNIMKLLAILKQAIP